MRKTTSAVMDSATGVFINDSGMEVEAELIQYDTDLFVLNFSPAHDCERYEDLGLEAEYEELVDYCNRYGGRQFYSLESVNAYLLGCAYSCADACFFDFDEMFDYLISY